MTDFLPPHVSESLARILAGESTPDDHLSVQQWTGDDPERVEQVTRVYRFWREGAVLPFEGDVISFLRRIHTSIPNFPGATESPSNGSSRDYSNTGYRDASWFTRRWHVRTMRPGVAGVVGALATALVFAVAWGGSIVQKTTEFANGVSVYSTGNGQQASVMLPDGSSVLLNVGSRLEVPADYASGNRTLRLSGEAFFTVRHHTKDPLRVIAGAAMTKVLGTQFVVRLYPEDSAATVAVKDGRVAVHDVVLSSNEQMIVTDRALSPIEQAAPTTFTFAEGILTLTDMPLAEAIPQLNRWYNVDLHLGSADLGRQRIRGGFSQGSISNVMEILSVAFEVDVVRSGRTLTLYTK